MQSCVLPLLAWISSTNSRCLAAQSTVARLSNAWHAEQRPASSNQMSGFVLGYRHRVQRNNLIGQSIRTNRRQCEFSPRLEEAVAGAGPPSRINMENCTCRHSKSPAPAIQALSLDKPQPLALSSPQFAWRELVSSDRLSLFFDAVEAHDSPNGVGRDPHDVSSLSERQRTVISREPTRRWAISCFTLRSETVSVAPTGAVRVTIGEL